VNRRDVALTRGWVRDGTAVLRAAVDRLDDEALRGPSVLPGWTRAHVIGHVARNAEALGRLAAWARTGVETPMYAGPEQRSAEIEASAARPAAALRAELVGTAADLDAALDLLDETTWQAPVRSALGRPLPAAEVPWMRVREVWLHAVDLDAGVGMADLPADVVDALLDDVTGMLSARAGSPALRLDPTDRERAWALGAPGPDAVTLRGPAAALVGWLTGRTGGTDLTAVVGLDPVPLPAAPRWI
jgi:maleylpyruvate isomerase